MNEDEFRTRLREMIMKVRIEKGITQGEMAKACGIGRPTYNMKENGKYKFTAYEVYRISLRTGVFIDYLMGTGGWK